MVDLPTADGVSQVTALPLWSVVMLHDGVLPQAESCAALLAVQPMVANAPPPGAVPAMDGFVADYISTFTGEVGRQPDYEEYAQIMTGYTPQQLPVLSSIAREFGVFDHWFSEVPSQTFMNRSFWTAARSDRGWS